MIETANIKEIILKPLENCVEATARIAMAVAETAATAEAVIAAISDLLSLVFFRFVHPFFREVIILILNFLGCR